MTYLLVRHKIGDFTQWKSVYDAHEPERRAAGLTEKHIWRNLGLANELFIMLEVADVQKAKAFVSSRSLHDAMQKAGVLDQPEVYFLV